MRDYLYGFLMLAAVTLFAVAGIAFSAAHSAKDYLAGIGLVACGSLMFAGARRLKGPQADADMQAVSDSVKKIR